MVKSIKTDWDKILEDEMSKDYFLQILSYLSSEYQHKIIYPPKSQIFASLNMTSFSAVKVVILGQDPYINDNQANGLAFGISGGKFPPSLRNIFRELSTDIGCEISNEKHTLCGWARQGVLLLNSTLTTRAGESNAHKSIGWQRFTDAIISILSSRKERIIFVLWGNNAKAKAPLISSRHLVIESAHPSPLSAYNGFFGSKPFSRINSELEKNGQKQIDWAEVD